VPVQHFLEHNARSHPDKTALVCGTSRLSYVEIERAANRLAHGLQTLDVAQGDRIALLLPNSVEAVVSIFGVLKAGAVFVPLDPATRQDKLAHILRDCAAVSIVVTFLAGLFSLLLNL